MTRIVNLYGGPGSGKSTIMAGLFWYMRTHGVKCEMAPEWIKDSIFSGDPYPFQNQEYTFAQQLKRLDVLRDKTDYVITDAPLLMSHIYGHERYIPESFERYINDRYRSFHNFNIVLERAVPYDTEGRIQDEDESIKIDREILYMLHQYNYEINLRVSGDENAPRRIYEYIKKVTT